MARASRGASPPLAQHERIGAENPGPHFDSHRITIPPLSSPPGPILSGSGQIWTLSSWAQEQSEEEELTVAGCSRRVAAESTALAPLARPSSTAHRIEPPRRSSRKVEMRPAAAAAASVLHAPRRALGRVSLVAARCASSSPSVAAATSYDHVSFVKEIAATDPPEHLNSLLNVLHARGEKIVSPGAKRGLIPLVVPLSESPQGNLTSLLRWPTAPRGMEMPVVEVRDHGLWLLAKNVNQYIHRILVEADSSADSGDDLWSAVRDDLWSAVGEAGGNIYKRGDFKESQMKDLDVYLLKKVGLFPDIIERKASQHLEKGDQVSALITGEFYTRDQFPGFGRPFVFNSELQKRVGRTSEAKESARVALKSPWWTLGCKYEEAAELAGWEDEQIEFIREKVTEEGKQEDLKKGKAPEQVVLDEAAFLMDLATVDGNWDDVVDRIAECYREAGVPDIAKFIAYRE